MQSKDSLAHTFLWENLHPIMAENRVSKIKVNGFMASNAHANWNDVRKI